MSKKKVFKLKQPYLNILKVVVFILCILIFIYIFYCNQIGQLMSVGYSRESSKKILFSFKKDYALSVGDNKTLNAAFESSNYKENNIDNYAKIKYQKQENIINNINTLLEDGYSNSDISLILAHGNDSDVSEFAKRKKIKYLDEFYSVSYAKLRNYDRYVKYSDETGEDEETTVLYVNLNMDKDDYTDVYEVKKFSTDMLVNKHRSLGEKFVPDDLVSVEKEYRGDDKVKGNRLAINAFYEMAKAAKKDSKEIVINSGYRSYKDQEDISNTYKKLYGEDYVKKYVSRPGFSEHQTGLAFDVGSKNSNVFVNSEEYDWMIENAHKYGFILRFTKKHEAITGFRNEAWHFRYVGKKIATYVYENKISYEEYYMEFLDKE